MEAKTTLTWDQFLAAGKPGQRWEYMDGEVRFMSPTGFEHGLMISLISRALVSWQDRTEGWVWVGADVAFTMAGGDWLCPDAAVVRRERVPKNLEGPAPFPPDVAFEVISPKDTWADIHRKRQIYAANGVVQVWVDPQKREVEVISPKHGTRTFREGETVIVEDLPGFGMNLFPLPSAGSESKS
jgi:Uma2 family endonuclease